MSNERLYYIQPIDKWLTYSEAHEYGYTLSRPLLKTYYTQDLQPVQIRVDSESGELYDLRAQAPHSWVTDIDSLNLYRFVGDVTLYIADKSNTYDSYSSSISLSEPYNIAYNGEIVSYEDLYNSFGITKHPCKIYIVQDGNVLSWYDEEENLYWDVRKKQWQTYQPSPEQESDDSIIKPLPDPVLKFDQWEDNLSQLPTIQSLTGTFFPAPSIYTSLSPSQKMVSQWEDFQNLTNDMLYTDILQTWTKIYVKSEDGVDDYQGNHYNYGDNFIGDYQYVYVDSDSDDTFYLGTQQTIFPRSHDDQNPTLYYVDGKYILQSEVHDLGYTLSISESVKIFDYLLLDQQDSTNV